MSKENNLHIIVKKIHTCWLIINASAYKANINSLHSVENSCRKFKIPHFVATPPKFKILKNVLHFYKQQVMPEILVRNSLKIFPLCDCEETSKF